MILRRCVAELIGTFALVFIGCGSACTIAPDAGWAGHLAINLAFGFVITAMISALGPICAAHFNPAVTFGFALAKRFPWRAVPAYWVSQISGAILGAATLKALIPDQAIAANFGATIPHVVAGRAFGIEIVITFFLMLVIIAVATDRRVHAPTPALAIGLTVTFCGLFAGPLTGSSMNPARSLGPALFAVGPALSWMWLYAAAPMVGAAIAALAYEAIRNDKETAQSAPASW